MTRLDSCWYKTVCSRPVKECNSCIRYKEMNYLMENSKIPKSMQLPNVNSTLGIVDTNSLVEIGKIKANIVEFVNRGYSLYLCSKTTGNGKTTQAISIMTKYFDTIWYGNGLQIRGIFIHVPTFLLRLKEFDNPMTLEEKELIMSTDLIIWDDIGTSLKTSEYDLNQLLMFIDSRVLNSKSNIYTSNICDIPTLAKTLGKRLASRIYLKSKVIEFLDKTDYRGVEEW